MTRRSVPTLTFVAIAVAASSAQAQGWRLRFDANAQRVEYRGVTPDSILATDVVTGANGGPETPDGYAVTCGFDDYCRHYRQGAVRAGLPAGLGVDLAMWGLGITGLSVRVSGRTMGDLSGDQLWPGTTPTLRLLEGYAEYLRSGFTARVGRMLEQGRLTSTGMSGLDGVRANWHPSGDKFEVGGYAGWGLARGTILPVTSPEVNPLEDYQPTSRQHVYGVLAGAHTGNFDVQAEYRRELDPETNYIVAERTSLSTQLRPVASVRVVAGVDYDIAQGLLGNADATISYTGSRLWATVGGKHYRPFFDLWTVWGVFSPVPYNGVNATLGVRPITTLQLRARGEFFKYDEAETETASVPIEDQGYRWGLEGTFTPVEKWTIEARGHGELLPGATSSGIDGRLTWHPQPRLDLSLTGGALERPLEFRYQDNSLTFAGGAVDYYMAERWRFGVAVDRYWETRDRPDALAFDWNQWRLSARMSVTLKSSADNWQLPSAKATR